MRPSRALRVIGGAAVLHEVVLLHAGNGEEHDEAGRVDVLDLLRVLLHLRQERGEEGGYN